MKFGFEPPKFNENNFNLWKSRMSLFLDSTDYNIPAIIKNGPHVPVKPETQWSEEDKKLVHLDVKIRHMIAVSLPDSVFQSVMNCSIAKDMWDRLCLIYELEGDVKKIKVAFLYRRYDSFVAKKGETVTDTFNRFQRLVNDLRVGGFENDDSTLVRKFTKALPHHWDDLITRLKMNDSLNKMSLAGLYGTLLYHEQLEAETRRLKIFRNYDDLWYLNFLPDSTDVWKLLWQRLHLIKLKVVNADRMDEFGFGPPKFDEDDFYLWKYRISLFLVSADINIPAIIENGLQVPVEPKYQWSENEKKLVHLDVKIRNIIAASFPNNVLSSVARCRTAKDMWDTLCDGYEGTENVKGIRKHNLKMEYDTFSAKRGESLTDTYNKFNCLLNDLSCVGIEDENSKILHKFMDALPTEI